MIEVAAKNDGTKSEVPALKQEYPSLFGNRNFLLLWGAYVISALGDRIHFLVMLTLLEQVKNPGLQPLLADGTANPAWSKVGTQETAQLNIMMLAPFLLLGPLTGVIADRLPRRLVMIGSDFARTLIVLLARTLFLAVPATSSWHDKISWMPALSYVMLMLLVSELGIAVFSAFFSPARTALLPNLVHPNQLTRANSMTNAAGTIASLIGFIIGGALVKWHLEIAMYIDAATFGVSGLLLMGMRRTSTVATAAVSKEHRHGFIREFVEGVKYLLQHKRALQVILLMFLFWCAGAIILSGLTGVVTKKYGKDVDWFGYFLGVVGIGMMAGAAICSIAKKGVPKEVGIAWAMTMVGLFLFLFSVPAGWGPALAFLVICGFFGAVLLVSLDTLLQRIVPNFVRGRVMAARDMLANVGLVGIAIPLALDPKIDDYIVTILRIVGCAIVAVGVMLILYYYKRTSLPLVTAIVRRTVAGYMELWHRFEVMNAVRIPPKGPVILVSNHTSALDPLAMQSASKKRLIRFMMAKEYYEKKPLHYFFRWLGVIPVNRTGNDTASIRTALRLLKDGEVIGMYPEGGISDDGRMLEGKQGVALLALSSGATVVPAYMLGTHVCEDMMKDFKRRANIKMYFGAPLRFDDLKGKERDEASRVEVTRRIMDAITALRDKYETDPDRRISHKEWAEANPEEAKKLYARVEAAKKAKEEADAAAAKKTAPEKGS